MTTIPLAYLSILRQLFEGGSEAVPDRHGRIVLQPENRVLPGGPVEWLWLVARGLVEGDSVSSPKVKLTDHGRQAVAEHRRATQPSAA